MNKIKVVHILPILGYGGIARMLYAFYEKIDRSRFEFVFIHFGDTVDYHRQIIEMGGRVISIPTIHKAGFKGFKRALLDVFQNECTDCKIIHIHLNYLSGLVAKYAKFTGIPCRICHIRGVLIDGKKKYFLPVYRFMIKKYCTYFLAVSKESGEFYYGKHFPFAVLNNGLDYVRFHQYDNEEIQRIKRACNIQDDVFIIVQVGRLAPEKNYLFSLELIAQLRVENIPVALLIAGEGKERDRITDAINKMELRDCVYLLGNIDNIQNVFCLCDCSLLPSISEGMPNVVMQSQCVGKPCIVSDVITKDVDLNLGLVHFCSLSDRDEWVNKIKWLKKNPQVSVSDKEIYLRLKNRSFLLEGEVKKLENIYEQQNGE